MRKFSVLFLICLVFLVGSTAFAKAKYPPEYKNRFGVRGSVGVGLYNFEQQQQKVASGISVPVRILGTYGITDALEVFAGAGYSVPVTKAPTMPDTGSLASKNLNIQAGFRYYFNSDDPVKFYIDAGAGLAVMFMDVAVTGGAGFSFDISDNMALNLHSGYEIAGLIKNNPDSLLSSLSLGFQYRF